MRTERHPLMDVPVLAVIRNFTVHGNDCSKFRIENYRDIQIIACIIDYLFHCGSAGLRFRICTIGPLDENTHILCGSCIGFTGILKKYEHGCRNDSYG